MSFPDRQIVCVAGDETIVRMEARHASRTGNGQLQWATFQVLRRTNANLSRKAKIDDKVAADQRDHGLGVSLEVYSIRAVQQKIDAAKRLESEVIQ